MQVIHQLRRQLLLLRRGLPSHGRPLQVIRNSCTAILNWQSVDAGSSHHAFGRQHQRINGFVVAEVGCPWFLRISPPRGLSASVPGVGWTKQVSPNWTELLVQLLPTLRRSRILPSAPMRPRMMTFAACRTNHAKMG